MKNWQAAEENARELIEGKATVGSGNKFDDGDVINPEYLGKYLVEVKSTTKRNIVPSNIIDEIDSLYRIPNSVAFSKYLTFRHNNIDFIITDEKEFISNTESFMYRSLNSSLSLKIKGWLTKVSRQARENFKSPMLLLSNYDNRRFVILKEIDFKLDKRKDL